MYIIKIDEYILPDIASSHLKVYCKTNIHDARIKFFEFKLFKYLYDSQSNSFHAIKFDIKTSQEKIHKYFLQGLNQDEIMHQKLIFGDSDLDIKVDSLFSLFIKEVTDPFYIFQVLSIILWLNNHYVNYAIVIIITTIISLVVSVYDTWQNLLSIQKMAKYSCPVQVYRRSKNKSSFTQDCEAEEKLNLTVSSVELVPGDLLELPEDGLALPCDMILVNGTVIVNESMLTGESTPIVKTHIPNTKNQFDASLDKKYILYAGTKIIQKRAHGGGKVLGLVFSTAFNTEKGNLIRSILFPKEVEFKFKSDSVKYILFMACLSFTGFLISLPFMIKNGTDYLQIFLRAMDLVTTTVPPSLPACIGIGISYALSRLRKSGIKCINRDRVNVTGKINMICFDKTGTLTEDHLDINGFRPVTFSKNSFNFETYKDNCRDLCSDNLNYYKSKMNNGPKEKSKDLNSMFVECLATCHSITKVNGKMVGDPIDVKMFEASGWTLKENLENQENYDSLISTYVRPAEEKDLKDKLSSLEEFDDEDLIMRTHYELGIVRRFDFSSKLQRMSVIVKNVNEPYFKSFCKGSPEKIKELCKADTIPVNFNFILNKYTMKGYRVLALAAKVFKMDYMQSQRVERNVIESNMIFLGLLIVQNKLKEKTSSSIETLHNANLKMVMATGDNILTAISVAKECQLIDSNVPIYTCELNKENNEQVLSWNMVDTFLDREEDKSLMEENMQELNFTQAMLNGQDDLANAGITHYFHPESLGEINPSSYDSRLILADKEKDFVNKEIAQDIESEVLNIDVEKYPNKEEEFIISITGSTFEHLWKLRNKYLTSKNERYKLHYETFRLVLQNCYIYARMSPDHKTILVDCLREEKFTVCMCGDGANDCGALRAADVGVSLSSEEASIAAPFTSNIADISCLIKLFREGKASLVSSIQTFKYMMIYSIIQFVSVTILMIFNSYLTDNQFLVSDLFIIFPMAILIARTGAYYKLTPHQPTGALISIPIVSSILLQTVIQFMAQLGIWFLLANRKWYKNYCDTSEDSVEPCMDNTVILFYF